MISVAIMINGNPIMARSAHRRTARHAKGNEQCYMVDTGELVYHDPNDGAVKLAIKLLETIKEDEETAPNKPCENTNTRSRINHK